MLVKFITMHFPIYCIFFLIIRFSLLEMFSITTFSHSYILCSLKLGYLRGGGVVFSSTSTASSYCTVALPTLKTVQNDAGETGKDCKSREIRKSRGCGFTEAATTQFFSSEI